ncbi:uncharacterized protein N7469_002578 [Penicillium citrinum]|uniref:Uncharacterized protein n=2 Tax=Penicillium TaxID=5073 RepID=A0A9W9PDM6_PENCI|nr:uncharacterized protein N7469_002578 [Penicillium citrinum]KAJ5240987.1 hypothetical protein N7469_002578 [Penicillium citrinum]KAJ5585984.1 hypothetical protein N7450_005771 [Penicillium hetheringtonii]KAK5789595.1 hypothetical protein VI817_008718 [Penicillium citrinum]
MYESKPENRVIDDLQPGLVSLPALYFGVPQPSPSRSSNNQRDFEPRRKMMSAFTNERSPQRS